ncbi:thiamine biosynthesis lipoprotein [Novosphingobium sp. PhB165]|uniref:FAD:protein FMN transferase n=1 Tax=Novosphingobium sp. PhB165 TaxID=2485105 RepID=UPI0010CE0B16|nr:FAD:protein FMN transferase [Novosphingobium sp. PhB165]TCM21654.1 thiamine biosynthesis lipoprotein [Novosphingobium sp. PhB165]
MRIALPAHIDAHAFADCDPRIAVGELHGETMGTTWSLRFAAPEGTDVPAIRAAVEARLATIIAEMSHWEPESLLCRFNRAPAGSWAVLPDDFAAVIGAGLAIAEASGGAFDPAIGRLVDLWGFGPPGPKPVPDALAVTAAREASGWTRLTWDAPTRRLRQPGGLALDFSGIAKGYAVDVVADLLAGMGMRHMLVEIGGELAGRGVRPDGEPWWVDLETPPGIATSADLSLRLALHDIAVATSGNYRRGEHTIDPRTGRPTENGLASVSVIAPSAMLADGWASALTVAGPEHGPALAAKHGLAARFVTIRENAVQEILTSALEALLAD